MVRRKNVKRVDPRYFLHEQGMPAQIAQQLDQIVLSAASSLRAVLESGALSASKNPEAMAAAGVRGEEAPRSEAGGRLEGLIGQYVEKLDELAALQLGRGGTPQRGGDAAARICGDVLGALPPCPQEGEACAMIRSAVGYLACLEQGDGGPWLSENGLLDTNQQIYGALNDVLRSQFQ